LTLEKQKDEAAYNEIHYTQAHLLPNKKLAGWNWETAEPQSAKRERSS
jgi:hypothetical protein